MARSFAHWNARYLYDRARQKLLIRRNPDWPWVTAEAVRMLEQLLRPDDVGIEYGSGRSTLWFAKRLKRIVSVEHHQGWFEKVEAMIAEQGASNAKVVLRTPEEFAGVISEFEPGTLGFVLVDGQRRDECAMAATQHLKPGGLLVIDDVHRYLPSKSRAPLAKKPDEFASDMWREFDQVTAGWRRYWSCDGVSDTLFLFKP